MRYSFQDRPVSKFGPPIWNCDKSHFSQLPCIRRHNSVISQPITMKFGTHTGGAAGEVCHLWLPCFFWITLSFCRCVLYVFSHTVTQYVKCGFNKAWYNVRVELDLVHVHECMSYCHWAMTWMSGQLYVDQRWRSVKMVSNPTSIFTPWLRIWRDILVMEIVFQCAYMTSKSRHGALAMQYIYICKLIYNNSKVLDVFFLSFCRCFQTWEIFIQWSWYHAIYIGHSGILAELIIKIEPC